MIYTAGGNPAFTTTVIPALTEVTIYNQVYVYDHTSADPQYMWHFGGNIKIGSPGMWIEDSKLWYSNWDNDILFGATQGQWTCPITDGHHIIGIKFNMSDQRVMDPVIFIDGVSQTITEEKAPVNSLAHPSDIMCFGGYFFYNPLFDPFYSSTNTWQGKIGEFYLHSGLHTDAQMEILTRKDLKRKAMHLESSSLVYYFPFDEIPDQVQIGTTHTLYPSGDVNAEWSTKTSTYYWSSVILDNETDYIRATGTDDNEEQIFDLTSFTLDADETVYAVKVIIKGLHSDIEEVTPYLWIDGVATALGSTKFTGTTAEFIRYYKGSLTQSQIDGMQVGLKVGSVAKGEYAQVSFLSVQVITATNKWDDWVGGLAAVSENALGWAEFSQSYP